MATALSNTAVALVKRPNREGIEPPRVPDRVYREQDVSRLRGVPTPTSAESALSILIHSYVFHNLTVHSFFSALLYNRLLSNLVTRLTKSRLSRDMPTRENRNRIDSWSTGTSLNETTQKMLIRVLLLLPLSSGASLFLPITSFRNLTKIASLLAGCNP
jgi:hypothetical protein